MKKKWIGLYFPKGSMAKIVLRMKLLTFFVLIALVSSAASTYSQETKFSLKLNGVTVREVFKEIEENSKFILLYNEKQVDVNRNVNVKVDNETVESILNQVLEGSDNTYKIYDRQIVILAKEKTESPNVSNSVVEAEQKITISGTVNDASGSPVPGVSVIVKGSTTGTITDGTGKFTLQISPAAKTLVFSFVGMKSQEVAIGGKTTFNVALAEETFGVDEVMVTGVFDKRTKMESSIAISAINTKQIQRLAVTSSADLLKSVPGVYVNSSLGEIRNTVYSRGVSVGSNDGASGYYYVSMQEDGLPVTNATYGNYGPDYFLRSDATIGRLEAVRGGTSSILGANAPGGIFNYIMKEGGDKVEGEITTKYGLEANGHSNFFRTDFNVGGPLSKGWTYDFGGFYRYDQGQHPNGSYPMNDGAQVKANIVKKYNTGSLKFYAKYLNDRNGWFEFTPTTSFTDPKPAEGFTNYSTVLAPSTQQSFQINQTGDDRTYNNRDQIHSIDKTVGFNWTQHFGNDWTFTNNMRYSDKSAQWSTQAVVYPLPMTDLVTYAILGLLGQPGTYSFRGLTNGKELLNVTSYSGYDFNVNKSSLPGNAVMPNSFFFEPLVYVENDVKELLEQFSVSKKFKNMSFTFGGFYGNSKIAFHSGFGAAGAMLGTIQDRPEIVGITLTDFTGVTKHVTNGSGVMGSTGATNMNDANQSQLAFYFGHTWQITKALNFDWGVRWETMHPTGNTTPSVNVTSTNGGLDNDPNTLYDNTYATTPNTFHFDKKISTFSFSAGANYTFNEKLAIYGRVSEGNKAPDLDMYFNANTDFLNKTLDPIAQKVDQVELGVKIKTDKLNLFVTPFYSVLSNVPNVQNGTNKDGQTRYSLPYLYNKYITKGVEIETDYALAKHFNVHGVLTLQKGIAKEFNTWITNELGPQDDAIKSYSGNETDNLARSIINITPSYNTDKFYAQMTWAYMGKRQANVANAFFLPSFSQFNFSTGYNLAKNLQLSAVINNVFNTYGVMSWSRPGSFVQALDRQGFTKEMYNEAVKNNTPYSTVMIPARSYFLTLSYKF